MPSSNDRSAAKSKAMKRAGVTRFHRMAIREGGISREDAVKKVAQFVEKLKPTYLEWLQKDMERLETQVERLKSAQPGGDEWTLAYRQTCAVRDLGATFGYHAVTEVADSMCELLQRLEHGTARHDQAIDAHMRALQLVGSVESDALSLSSDQRLIDGLRAVVEKFPPRARGDT